MNMNITLFVSVADSHQEFSSGDSHSTTSAACEVYDFPAGCTAEMLQLIFENRKFTGVAGAKIVDIQFIDDSHAIITFSSHEGYYITTRSLIRIHLWIFQRSDTVLLEVTA